MNSYLCITAGEWRNLSSMGRIRIQEARAISAEESLCPDGYNALFSLGADRFMLGETSDFLITEYSCLRSEIEGIQPPGFESGIRWLLLQDVIRFFPLRADDAWAFEADAHKAQVALSDASFEHHWKQWFKDQVVDQACINGLTMVRVLGLRHSSSLQEAVIAPWSSLARQIVAPDLEGSDAPGFSASFLSNRDRLFDLVREDADSGAFFVSCPIEWINLRSNSNISDTDPDLVEHAQRLHEKYKNVAFDPFLVLAKDLQDFEGLLRAKAPGAFPGVWRPAMISLYIRYGHRIKFGSSSPDDIVASVRAIDTPDDRLAAEMLAFLFGVELGSNKTHSLDRLLNPKAFERVSGHPSAQP